MTRAAIYVDGPPRPRPEEHDIGRWKKLQACRAYCARLGYEVVAVITTAKRQRFDTDEAMRIYDQSGGEALRAYLKAQPHHPKDDAEALLESGEVDVLVEYTPIGDSGPFEWHYTPEMLERLPPPPRIEQASLWEIEPPTPERRQHYYWREEDRARQHKGERTRAVIYVRGAVYPSGRMVDNGQEQYCGGYCARQSYEVVEVCRDTSSRAGAHDHPDHDQEEWPGLSRAVAIIQDDHAHLLVALNEGVLAADREALAALQAQVPRIEYARSYAAGVQLKRFIEAMEQLKAILDRRERTDGTQAAGEPPAEATALDLGATPAIPTAHLVDFDAAFAVFPDLETAALRLRRPLPGDAAAIRAMYANAVVASPSPVAPRISPAEALALIEGYRRSFEEHIGLCWAVVRTPGDTPLGICGFVGFERAARRGQLGLVVGRSRWRQGLMAEAVHAVLAFGFERLDLHRIEAVVVDGDTGGNDTNAPARTLLTKLGFTAEGRLRERFIVDGQPLDEHRFGLLRADYRRQRSR